MYSICYNIYNYSNNQGLGKCVRERKGSMIKCLHENLLISSAIWF